MISAEHFQQKDYRILKDYIDRGIPVLINVRYTGATRGLRPGPRGHWIVLRGIDDKYVWVNDPGRSPEMRSKGENIRYPIKKQVGNPSYLTDAGQADILWLLRENGYVILLNQ